MSSDTFPKRGIFFVEAVLHRPTMYTPNGTLEEAFCFLNGYYSGIAWRGGKRDASAGDLQTVEHEWDSFLGWVAPRLQGCGSDHWMVVYRAIRRAHAQDAEAFAALLKLYEEYVGPSD
jgi:hypothetical protein